MIVILDLVLELLKFKINDIMESTPKFKSGGKLKFDRFKSKRIENENNIDDLDNELLLEYWEMCVAIHHYSFNQTLEEYEKEIGYTKDDLYYEILTRMNN